jgi:hypothetical protein
MSSIYCFFSNTGGASFSAQIGVIVVFGVVAAILMIVGLNDALLLDRYRRGSVLICSSLGCLLLWFWWASQGTSDCPLWRSFSCVEVVKPN